MVASAISLACLAACSSGNHVAALPNGAAAIHRASLSAGDFKRVVSWGSKGKPAVAQCPQGDKVIAGGSSSSDGSSVATGYADSRRNAWIVKPDSSASAEAFATCIARKPPGTSFEWRAATPASGLAGAQCRSGYTLVTGYAFGTATASWFDSGTNTFWVSGGGDAYASCARDDDGIIVKHAWNKSQKPKTVYAGCGAGRVVIGGSIGDSVWPGPPIQEHPGGASGPSEHGYSGWWAFSNAANVLTWAACVRS